LSARVSLRLISLKLLGSNGLNVSNYSPVAAVSIVPDVPREKIAVGGRHRHLSASVAPIEHILERLDVSEIFETLEFPFQFDFELLNL